MIYENFYSHDQLHYQCEYDELDEYDCHIVNGFYKEWYRSGQLKWHIFRIKNITEGEEIFYEKEG